MASWYNSRLKRNKFNARAVYDIHGQRCFDSTGESVRYNQLELLEKAGEISSLELHPKVVLIDGNNDVPEIAWRIDYAYTEKGRKVWEDYKPRPITERERLLIRLWKHFGPGPLRITGKNGRIIKTVFAKRDRL